MFFTTIPRFFSYFFKDAIFFIKKSDSSYLTFDDGPFPESTPDILDKLKSLQIKATFFCSGSQAEKHPQLIRQIQEQGHLLGNHGYSHFNGWKTNEEKYIDDINKSKAILKSNLFRPPYGKLSWNQYSKLKANNIIVMWDSMPGDFDKTISEQNVISNFNRNIKPGSIIVLHDNPKSKAHCLAILKQVNKNLSNNFETLNCLL